MVTDPDLSFWMSFCPTAFGEGRHVLPGSRRFLQPEGLDARTVKAWVSYTTRMFKLTTTEWARRAKLAPSTLNRFMKSPGPENLSATTISALARVLDSALQEGSLEVSDFSYEPPSHRMTWTVPVIGTLRDVETETMEWGEDKEYKVSVTLNYEDHFIHNFAIQVASSSYEDFSLGDVLICNPAQTLLRRSFPGQKYLCHRREADGSVSSSIRKLIVDPEGERWLTRIPGSPPGKAIVFDDVPPSGVTSELFVSFGIIAAIKGEPWLDKFVAGSA